MMFVQGRLDGFFTVEASAAPKRKVRCTLSLCFQIRGVCMRARVCVCVCVFVRAFR